MPTILTQVEREPGVHRFNGLFPVLIIAALTIKLFNPDSTWKKVEEKAAEAYTGCGALGASGRVKKKSS